MNMRSFLSALSIAATLSAGAEAQGPAPAPVRAAPPAAAPQAPVKPAPPPPAGAPLPAPSTTPAPAVGSGATRPLPDRPPATFEGLEPQPGGLTADEVARRALAASATVKEKRAQLEAANEKINETTFQFLPRATLTASYQRTSPIAVSFGSGVLVGALTPGPLAANCAAGAVQCPVQDAAGKPVVGTPVAFVFPSDNYLLNGHLSVPISDYVLRLASASEAASSSRDAAKYYVEAERLKVASDARSLYFNWLRARAQAAIAKNAVERTRARLEDARATFAAGQISKADLLRIEAQVANTELVLTNANSLVSLTAGQLAIVMEDPHPDYRVGESIPQPASVPEESANATNLIAEAQRRRFEVRAIDETVRGLHAGANATRANAMPKVEAIGDVTYANPNPKYFPPVAEFHTTWAVGAQATWTIGDTLVNAASARELDAQARAALAQRKALYAGIAQEVLSAYLDVARARAAFESQRAALAAAEEGYRVTTDLFRAGRATSTDLVLSESDLLDAKLGDVNARIDLTIAAITLRHATARDVSGGEQASRD